jgi:two-component system chemotaxis response regulator CheB
MRRVFVLGGSAGSIKALCTVLKELPGDFPAPLLAVIHIGEGENMLREVLQRCTKLEVTSPVDAEPLVEGKVYIAPPNRHLAVRKGCVFATHGARENRNRPAIDALFRSAARAYRSRVAAVVLSGALDDGVAGCMAVEARGGTIIVQDPKQAANPEMPENVLRQIKTDYCLPVQEIGALLNTLARNGESIEQPTPTAAECAQSSYEGSLPITNPLAYTCPECNGSLSKIVNGESEQYRCNVGHIYSLESFSLAHSNAVERALWMALQRLNEQRSVQEHLAGRAQDPRARRHYLENASAAAEDMRLLKEIIAGL